MTTENVAVLFTDVVGSTELAQRLSPDAADEARRRHFSILRQATAEAGGAEVKNLGDGLMVVFSSASSALSCGVAMQQGVERDNRDQEHSMGLRVGLSGGEVTREDDDYFGDPVIEAARLCATCRGGQILAADVVRAMAGRRSRHAVNGVGALTLKGLPDPVETVEVTWEPLGAEADERPLPARLTGGPSVGVVGRETEIEALVAATKRVAHTEGTEVVLISGEAGVGKTTLVAEAARAAFDDGACVLFGHCEEDLSIPYRLFSEALGQYVTYAPEEQLLDHVATYGSDLVRLVPALASRLPDLPPSTATDADTERYLLFGSVVGLLATVSQRQPVVLVLDDLQWADKGSLLLLRHVVSAENPMRVLVFGTYRDSELSYSHDLLDILGALHRNSGVTRIELSGLDDTGVVSLMEAAAGHALDETGVDLAHAVYRETDGNPFFVSEVLRHLTETGSIYQDGGGRWVTVASLEDTALPDSVRVVIGGRVGRLSQDAQRVLSQAAVIGQEFDLDVLARSTGTSEDDLLDVLDNATAVSLVREQPEEPGHYRFAHALIRRTLYEDLGPTRRARAHRRVGEALEELCGDRPGGRVGELAHHWFSATQPVDVSKAIEYSRQAADASLAALAPDEAVRYFSQAIQLLGQHTESNPLLEVDLLIGLGSAQRQAGVPVFRETLLDAAGRAGALGATDRMVEAALANNRGLFSSLGVVDDEKVKVLETVLDTMSPDDSSKRALLLATLCNELTHTRTLEKRQALANSAKDMARRLADHATVVQVLNLVEQPLEVPPTLEQRVVDATEALGLAETLGDPNHLYWATVYRRISAMAGGNIEIPTQCLAQARSLSDRLRQPILMWVTAFHEAAQALLLGDPERADTLATEALEIGTECGQPDAVSFYGSQLIIVRHQQGRLGEMIPIVEAVAAETGMAGYSAALAAAYLDADRDRALALLEDGTATGFNEPMRIGWTETITAFAQVSIELHHSKSASLLFDLFAPYRNQMGFNGLMPLEPMAMYLGSLASVLGRYDQAEAYFIASSEFSDRMGAKFSAARTDLSLGRMLLQRQAAGDAERARGLLTRAQTAAATHGYAGVERSAGEALSQLD
jgi:class 3 adenylate cyclase/tetratricopeptide (TPR) repeat protein